MKDIKYIIKRVIIGICIGIGILMFKNNFAFASTLNGTMSIKYNTDNCNISNDMLFCTTGSSYLFRKSFSSSSSSNAEITFPFIDTSNSGVMFTNVDTIYNFSTPVQIGDNTSIQITLYPFMNTNGEDFSFGFTYFPYYFDSTNNVFSYTYSNINFRPIYIAYNLSSDSGNIWHSTKLNYYNSASSGNLSYLKLYDIPSGSSVQKVRIIFGTTRHYSGATQVINGYTTPQYTSNWVYKPNGSSLNPSTLWTSMSDYKNGTNDNIGLFYLAQNTDTLPNYNSNRKVIGYNSTYPAVTTVTNRTTVDTSKGVIFDLSNVLLSDLEDENIALSNIEQQIAINQATIGQDLNNEDKDYINPLYNDWNNTYTNGFTSLFSTLFAYPLTKISQQVTTDLVRLNINGTYILNDYLCMKNSTSGIAGEYSPYKVQFFRDYKFTLPCPHTEIYTNLKYGNYAFYPTTFLNANLGSTIGATNNFASLWLTLQHGILVYLLFVNVLNVYKYILDSNKAEVEVLEL